MQELHITFHTEWNLRVSHSWNNLVIDLFCSDIKLSIIIIIII